jgi:hypothetical protein
MRLTVAHLRIAAIIGGVGLMAFAAMQGMYLIGYDSPFMPGVVSLLFTAAWIFLLRRYGPRPQQPIDPRRQRVWFLSSLAAAGALAVIGMAAALWMGAHAARAVPCPARSGADTVLSSDDVSNSGQALGAAAGCRQPS